MFLSSEAVLPYGNKDANIHFSDYYFMGAKYGFEVMKYFHGCKKPYAPSERMVHI